MVHFLNLIILFGWVFFFLNQNFSHGKYDLDFHISC